MTDLERQLAAYTDFLEQRSLARSADHTSPMDERGDVIVFDLRDDVTDRPAELRPVTGIDEPPGPSRWRWLAAAAAAAVLVVVAVFGLLNVGDEGASDLDTVDTPELLPAPADGDPIDFGAVMADAIAANDNSALEAVFSREATVSVDGRAFSDGFDAMTTARWFELMPFTFDCPATDGDGVITCRFSSSVLMLDDHDVDWVGDAQLTWVDGLVRDAALRSDDATAWSEAFDGYFGWLEATHADDFRQMFVPGTGFVETDDSAALHARYSAEYNELLALGERLTRVAATGSSEEIGALWSPSLRAVFDGRTIPPDALPEAYTTTAFRGLVDPRYDQCAVVGGLVVCSWLWEYTMLDDVDTGEAGSISFTVVDEVIVAVEQTTDDPERAIAALADYRDWVAANDPEVIEVMFDEDGAVSFTDESAALHATASQEYNATLG